jgi:peroxiredoxin
VSVCLGAALLLAKPPVPRPAQEFTITDSSGKSSSLSSYRGKVVVVQFLYTTCGHCQAVAGTYSRLQSEFGPRGLQVVGVAFNPEAQARPAAADEFVRAFGVTFPVGVATMESVQRYLGISVLDRFVVPQVVIIDRSGVVRAQSEFSGSPELQDEPYLRGVIEKLLKER